MKSNTHANAPTVFYVLVLSTVAHDKLGEDADALGIYAVHGRLAEGATNEDCVKDVLDAFHENIGIEDLDALDILVLDSDGDRVDEPEDSTSGHLLPTWGRLAPEKLAEDGVAWLADFLRGIPA